MLNNKGQSIVIFAIILPLLLLFITYVYDVSSVQYEKNRINSIAEIAKNSVSEDKCSIVEKNDNKITCTKEGTKIILSKRIKSIFGRILNKTYYDISVTIELGEM